MTAIPATMRHIAAREPGPPDVLTLVEGEVPRPQAGEVLIRVVAAGVNRPDVMQRQGKYPPPPGASDIPGLEIAGVIEATGPDAVGLVHGNPCRRPLGDIPQYRVISPSPGISV